MRLFVDTAQVVITQTPTIGPMHVLTMLLRNDLDAVFLPGGQLEELAAEGAIRAQDFKVLEPRPLQGYSGVVVSTESYPEWPLGVMVRGGKGGASAMPQRESDFHGPLSHAAFLPLASPPRRATSATR